MLYEKKNFDFYKVPYLVFAVFLVITITIQNLFLYIDGFINAIYISFILFLCIRYKMKSFKILKNNLNLHKILSLFYIVEIILYALISILLYLDSSKYTALVAKFNLESENIIVYSECRTHEDYILCLGFDEGKGVISSYDKHTGVIEQVKEN